LQSRIAGRRPFLRGRDRIGDGSFPVRSRRAGGVRRQLTDQSLDFIELPALCVNLCGGAINAGVGVLAANDFVKGVYSDQPARDRNERHRGAN
jgi:hypothetical protein